MILCLFIGLILGLLIGLVLGWKARIFVDELEYDLDKIFYEALKGIEY